MKGLAFPGSFQAVPATGDGVYSLCRCWADAMVAAISSSGKTSLFINFSIYANLNKNSQPQTLNSQPLTLTPHPHPFVLSAYAPLVQCLRVAGSVTQMLSIGDGIVVSARKVFFCTHIDVVVLVVVQYRINACNAGHTNRPWR